MFLILKLVVIGYDLSDIAWQPGSRSIESQSAFHHHESSAKIRLSSLEYVRLCHARRAHQERLTCFAL